MDDFKTDPGTYTPNDFILWQANDALEITPKFQRRSVWRTPARSFFIDTMLRGMTVPPIYFRLAQNQPKSKTVREVVDGQQRVRAVLEFIAGGYRLSKNLNATWANKKFDQLAPEEQTQIRQFSFPTQTFKAISDQLILQVFARLNMNGIGLNAQELRNGRFFGPFKRVSYDLAVSYLEFWRRNRIFTEQRIARMLEVELTSELLIAGSQGMQDKKKTITPFYERWEESYPEQDKDQHRFREVMATIAETFAGDVLPTTEFRRSPLFYSLYCVVFHHTYGLPEIHRPSPRKRLTEDQRESLKEAVVFLSEKIEESKDPAIPTPARYKRFIEACLRQTDNIGPRRIRFDALYDAAF